MTVLHKRSILLLVVLSVLCLFPDTSGVKYKWMKTAGGPSTANDIQVANDGSIYMVGEYTDQITIGNITFPLPSSHNIYLVKYASDGRVLWAKSSSGCIECYGLGISIGNDGSLYTVGHFSGSIVFGSASATSQGNLDVFIAKFDASGMAQWITSGGGTGIDHCNAVYAALDGSIYVTGMYQESASFGPFVLTTDPNEFNIFVAKFDSHGAPIWVQDAGGPNQGNLFYEHGKSITVSNDCESIYVTGSFMDTAIIGYHSITALGGVDSFIVKYDSSGTALWVERIGGTKNDYGVRITLESDGFLYAIGYFQGVVNFGVGYVFTVSQHGMYIAKYDTSGGIIWVSRATSPQFSIKTAGIAFPTDGSILVSTNFKNSTIAGNQRANSFAGSDFALFNLDSRGNFISIKYSNSSDGVLTTVSKIVTTADNRIYFAGTTSGAFTYESVTTNALNSTMFFAGLQTYVCYGRFESDSKICGKHGICSATDTCTCNKGYSGNECTSYSCFGVNPSSSSVCSTHGKCNLPDVCSCTSGYSGTDCSSFECYGIQSNSTSVCTGHGTCTAKDKCSCGSGYLGKACSVPICFGVLGSSTEVCSGHGVCTGNDICECEDTYYLEDCRLPKDILAVDPMLQVPDFSGEPKVTPEEVGYQIQSYFSGCAIDRKAVKYADAELIDSKVHIFSDSILQDTGYLGSYYELWLYHSLSDYAYVSLIVDDESSKYLILTSQFPDKKEVTESDSCKFEFEKPLTVTIKKMYVKNEMRVMGQLKQEELRCSILLTAKYEHDLQSEANQTISYSVLVGQSKPEYCGKTLYVSSILNVTTECDSDKCNIVLDRTSQIMRKRLTMLFIACAAAFPCLLLFGMISMAIVVRWYYSQRSNFVEIQRLEDSSSCSSQAESKPSIQVLPSERKRKYSGKITPLDDCDELSQSDERLVVEEELMDRKSDLTATPDATDLELVQKEKSEPSIEDLSPRKGESDQTILEDM